MTPRHHFLTRAAMIGLVAATQASCTSSSSTSDEGPSDETDASTQSNDQSSSGHDPSTPTTTDETGSGAEGGMGGAETTVMGVLSSKVVADLSLEAFTEMCDEVDGTVEVHSHCGGFVSGQGFSYDSDTDVFTEHTCAGYNTCTGFSCVVPE